MLPSRCFFFNLSKFFDRYLKQVIKLDEFAKDQPMKPIDKAVWWLEYVIRYKGAKDLAGNLRNVPFYRQIIELDVVAVLAITLLVVVGVAVKLFQIMFRNIRKIHGKKRL